MSMRWRRLAFAALCGATAIVAMAAFGATVFASGWSIWGGAAFALFILALPWPILNFWNAAIGLALSLRGAAYYGDRKVLAEPSGDRVLVAIPIRHEDVRAVAARLRAMMASIDRMGLGARIDFAVLSDSSDAEIVVEEKAVFGALASSRLAAGRVAYRRRAQNRGLKAGNLRAYLTAHRESYAYALVLDADSVMDGATISRMIALMDADPRLGVLQSLVVGAPDSSGFARMQRFGMRHGMRMFARGAAWWQGDQGPYWGHNAMIRVAPFIDHCALPDIPSGRGLRAFRGVVMSHDMAEAVLMRRAGWSVRVLPIEAGSFEGFPARLTDYIDRDLRWCRGNLQYALLLPTIPATGLGALHLALAIGMYLAGPAWMAFMGLVAVAAAFERSVFGAVGAVPPLAVFLIVIGLTFAPKLFGLAETLMSRAQSARFGGRWAVLRGAGAEALASTLLAPAIAFAQARFIVEAVAFGRRIVWGRQDRGVHGEHGPTLVAACGPGALYGLALAVAIGAGAPEALWWAAAPILGLIGAPAVAWLLADPRFGAVCRRSGLWETPEEREPPRVLIEAGAVIDAPAVPPAAAPARPLAPAE